MFPETIAGRSVTRTRDAFENLEPLAEPITVGTANGTMIGTHQGRVTLTVSAGNSLHDIHLSNVIYGRDMQSNLFSLPVLYDLGYEFSMTPGVGATIKKNGKLIADTVREGRLFRLAIPAAEAMISQANEGKSNNVEPKEEDIMVWHRRMAHL